MITDISAQQKFAAECNVIASIHPQDFIYHFLYNNPCFPEKSDAIKYYFYDGAESSANLKKVLQEICGYDAETNINMLEFASGYGCVTRHLKKDIPNCSVTSCDIHLEATQFLRNELGMDAVQSASVPEKLDPRQTFDTVFALSFFSHMPKSTFTRWMRKLGSLLKPGGHLIFTAHGMVSYAKHLPHLKFDRDGFAFHADSEQKDLKTAEYGTTCTKPQYVMGQIFDIPELTLKHFHEGRWWGHQDLYIVQRGHGKSR